MLSRQQPARMDAEREDFLASVLAAAVEGRPRRRAEIPFEQIAVQDADQQLPVLTPGERGGERARADRAVEGDRRRQTGHVVRIEPFGLFQVAAGELRLPRPLAPAGARRPRVEPRPIDVQPILVGLFPAERRRLEHDPADLDAGAHDTRRDVRRVDEVMRERRLRIVAGRLAVHEHGRGRAPASRRGPRRSCISRGRGPADTSRRAPSRNRADADS